MSVNSTELILAQSQWVVPKWLELILFASLVEIVTACTQLDWVPLCGSAMTNL